MSVFERLLTLLVASDGTSHRRGLGPALGECRHRKGPDSCPQQLCAGYIRVAKISSQQEARCGAYHRNGAAEKVAGDHSDAGDHDFVFASERRHGKSPRVPSMLVADHLRPAAEKVITIPENHRFGFHNLRHALSS